MNISFEKMELVHQKSVMEIFNHYIVSSTAAFPDKELPEQFYPMLLKKSEGYPAYVIKDSDCIIGFCFLSAYNPFNTFKETAALTYFITEKYTGKGIGNICLGRLEADAEAMGIHQLIAEISSENKASLKFHKKHGFEVAGELKNIGYKLNASFGVVYMQKTL